MNRRKPKVLIPRNVDSFLPVLFSVAEAVEVQANGIGPAAILTDFFDQLDSGAGGNGQYFEEITNHENERIAQKEASEAAISARNVARETLKDALYQVRDMALSLHQGNPSEIGRYGFEVRQSKTAGTQSTARVVIPSNPDGFFALYSRVKTILDGLDEVADPTISGLKGVVQEGSAVAAFNTFRDKSAEALVASEASQSAKVRRDRELEAARNILINIRNHAFGQTGPGNYEDVSLYGFEVQSDATQNVVSGRAAANIRAAKRGTFGNIQGSECNVNGVIDVVCIGLTFGTDSDEYEAVTTTDTDSSGTVQILDVAVTLGLLDAQVASSEGGSATGGFITP